MRSVETLGRIIFLELSNRSGSLKIFTTKSQKHQGKKSASRTNFHEMPQPVAGKGGDWEAAALTRTQFAPGSSLPNLCVFVS